MFPPLPSLPPSFSLGLSNGSIPPSAEFLPRTDVTLKILLQIPLDVFTLAATFLLPPSALIFL